jgi:hypothetical protein
MMPSNFLKNTRLVLSMWERSFSAGVSGESKRALHHFRDVVRGLLEAKSWSDERANEKDQPPD